MRNSNYITHGHYMKLALALAEKGAGFVSPNPMVGAVIVKDGIIVGKGFHKASGKAHAEINAINDAKDKALGADLYVTLEPCNHTGKTPPCTKAIIKAGIKRVFAAIKDPNPFVAGGGIDFLQKNGIEVFCGICEKEAERQNEIFIKYIKTKTPFVIAKCAATLDGMIAAKTGDSKWITGKKAREYGHMLRHIADAIMVGIGTVKNDNPSLTSRLDIKTKDPVRIILDTKLSISENAKVLTQKSNAKTYIITGDNISLKKKALENEKVKVIITKLNKNGQIELGSLMVLLGEMGIMSILIEGGGSVIASAFKSKIVDKICFFYAPKIFAANDGVPICFGEGPDTISQSLKIEDMNIKRFGDDFMVEGYISFLQKEK
jgi:diaminohydroxyphosphoribosylaminopyrimidine deaminase / 5-amino-6-(5-phosphoribosylamino)uracil reductase